MGITILETKNIYIQKWDKNGLDISDEKISEFRDTALEAKQKDTKGGKKDRKN